jgi:hypothetical protein
VYQEWLNDKINFDIVIIVGKFQPESWSYDLEGCAWCSGGEWEGGRGAFDSRSLKPHPDPDRAWAEYCAWRLTQ